MQPQFVKGIKCITCSTLGWHDDLLLQIHSSEKKLYVGMYVGYSYVFTLSSIFLLIESVLLFYEHRSDLFHGNFCSMFVVFNGRKDFKKSFDKNS